MSLNRDSVTYDVPNCYAVLKHDARDHGESGGLYSLDGPRELQDTIELFHWLLARPNIDPNRIGAFGASYGGGMVWLAAVHGVPFPAMAAAATWTDRRAAPGPPGPRRPGGAPGPAHSVPRSR